MSRHPASFWQAFIHSGVAHCVTVVAGGVVPVEEEDGDGLALGLGLGSGFQSRVRGRVRPRF